MIGEERAGGIERIPVGRIRPRAFGSRAEPGEAELRSLAASIRKHGLIHPILVRPAGRDYEVVCGQRRFLACRSIGRGEVEAVVRALDERQAFELSVAENARREALSGEERQAIVRRAARDALSSFLNWLASLQQVSSRECLATMRVAKAHVVPVSIIRTPHQNV